MSLTIGQIIEACTRARPTAVAATLVDEQITFADLDHAANRCANALVGLGVGRGDVVLYWGSTSLRALEIFGGAARAGAVFAPINPQTSAPEGRLLLEYLEPRLIICDATTAEVAAAVSAEAGAPLAAAGCVDASTIPGLDFDALCDSASAARPDVVVDERDPHIVYLTSGSTGRPKGALVSHRASWLRSEPGGGTLTDGLRGQGGVLNTHPLFHYSGWHFTLEAWQNRRAVHLVPRPSAQHLIDAASTWRPSAMYAIPAVWERLLGENPPPDALSSLEHADTGTSHTAVALLEQIKAQIPGSTTTVLYGSTEAGRMSALHDRDIFARPGSVGRPAFPGVLWVDPANQEVCCSSEAMMDGYLRLPAETAAALQDGVYRSGDLGHFDDDGYLYLTGRIRELIRTAGEWVGPVEVEAALRGFPGVLDVAVVGVPDPKWGEVVCAVFVLPDGAPSPEVAALSAYLDGRLTRFKHPRVVATAESIPRTPATGQVMRKALLETLGP